jgi:hypothetical protein
LEDERTRLNAISILLVCLWCLNSTFNNISEARLLQNTGATLITVAVGFTEVSAELTGLTSEPITENLIRVDNYDSLSQLRNKLVEPLCTGMIINILSLIML